MLLLISQMFPSNNHLSSIYLRWLRKDCRIDLFLSLPPPLSLSLYLSHTLSRTHSLSRTLSFHFFPVFVHISVASLYLVFRQFFTHFLTDRRTDGRTDGRTDRHVCVYMCVRVYANTYIHTYIHTDTYWHICESSYLLSVLSVSQFNLTIEIIRAPTRQQTPRLPLVYISISVTPHSNKNISEIPGCKIQSP